MKRKLLLVLLGMLIATCCAIGFAACSGDDEKSEPVSVDNVSQLAEQYGVQTKNFFVNEVIEKALPAETNFAAENVLGATVDLGDPQATELQSVKIVLFYANNAVDRVYSVSEIAFTEPVALNAVAGYNSESASSVNAAATELYSDNLNILDYAYNSDSLAEAIYEKVVQSDETSFQLTLKYEGEIYFALGNTTKVTLCNEYELFAQTKKTVKKYRLVVRQQDSEEEIIESLNNEKNYKIWETEEIASLQTPLIVSDYRQEDESDIPAAENFMTFEPYGNGYAVTGLDERYRGKAIEIPVSHNGMPVTSVGNHAFGGRASITSVTIPDSVTSIGERAFNGCSSLTSATIGSGITSIAASIFSGCDSLTDIYITDIASWCGIEFGDALSDGARLYLNNELVTDLVIPDGVTSIGDYAFAGFTSITSVTIPDSVTSIGRSTFSNCPIETATMPTLAIGSIPGTNLKTVVITIGKAIEDSEFRGYSLLSSVTLGNSVQSIGKSAFENCSALKSIAIAENLTSIGKDAFRECEALEGVYITNLAAWCGITFGHESDSTWNDTWANPLYFAKKLYLNGELVTDLVIPDGVTGINARAFSNGDFTSITIPDSVTSIGRGSFSDCPIEMATIPAFAIAYIPQENLKTVVITSGETISDYALSGCSSLTSVAIPDSVKSIGNYAFSGCGSLPNIAIPGSVESIGEYAFEDCTSLTSITLPDSVTSINLNAFDGCLLEDAKIPANAIPAMPKSSIEMIEITSGKISEEAFDNFKVLFSVTISGTVKEMETRAFSSCNSLTNVTIGGLVTAIPAKAFADCRALTNVRILDNVEIISYAAFRYCNALESVEIGSGIKQIYLEAFNGCGKLIDITYNGTMTEWNTVELNAGTKGTYVMNWDTDTGKYTIHCINGDIAKS